MVLRRVFRKRNVIILTPMDYALPREMYYLVESNAEDTMTLLFSATVSQT